MFYIADLHLHSHYSRATSKDLNLESLYQWARVKGINIVGTGDFTHPLWFKELKEKLEPDGTGLFRLKNPPKEDVPGFACADIDVRFCLTSEISSIYKHGDKVRKNHNCVYAPDLETVARINARLSQIGNLEADGRPILGLPARDLLEIVLASSPDAHLIPAHIWTPWFSMLGSKSGYDSVKECFRDLSDHIFALETGLSSDPEMNWQLSMLDGYTLVSNSDAHSPQKLGREANLFDTERSYYGLFEALKTRNGFLGTYEFFPEEGKYHMDGHRKCNVCFEPEESIRHKNLCPKCGQPLTIGVLHRVTELSDRKQPQRPEGAADFHYIIPLPEIISEIKGTSPSSKKVAHSFQQAISAFGNEFTLLKEVPVEEIERKAGIVLAEAIRRMREEKVNPQGGYDGEYGVIKIFKEGELAALIGQMNFFGAEAVDKTIKRESREITVQEKAPTYSAEPSLPSLNAEQAAVCATEGAVVVTAGPGTGKTQTLIHWIAHCIRERNARPQEVLAVTFTNKAADEMRERLASLLNDQADEITVGTFHALCFALLLERYPTIRKVYDDESRRVILGLMYPDRESKALKELSLALKDYFENGGSGKSGEIEDVAAAYREFVFRNGGIDLADIIGSVIRLWTNEPDWLETHRKRYHFIAVDELQDINPLQYRFLKLLASGKQVLAIGDPDQSIYGFRGSDVRLFFQFSDDFQATEIQLQQNYRSKEFIVEAAGQLIRNNRLRKDVSLVANKRGSGQVRLFKATDERAEAGFVVNEIEKLVGGFHNLSGGKTEPGGQYGFSDIAVLFRTRAVGRGLLTSFKQSGIPIRFGDATPFLATYPFHLITDVVKLYLDPGDLITLDSVLEHGFNMSQQERQAFISSHSEEDRFATLFGKEWKDVFAGGNAQRVVALIFEKLIPDSMLDDVGLLRKEMILKTAAEHQEGLDRFIHRLILDQHNDVVRDRSDYVNLLTFHASKGLEFPVVFIVGAEEGITPILRPDTELEEERRLFYVALTRAKDALYVTHSEQRRAFGEVDSKTVSRFVGEIPVSEIEKPRPKPAKPEQMKLF